MSHISSIGAGLYSDLSMSREVVAWQSFDYLEASWQALFATELANGAPETAAAGEFTRIKNIREFPGIGIPPNIVNVPVYGAKISQQVQGQSDAPSMELTLNYVGTDWQNTADYLGALVGDGKQYGFRFTLLNSNPASFASDAAGLGSVENSQYFWMGKLEALLVNPQLTDANTATLTLSVQSSIYGAYTNDAA